jgi:hypothetical protein
MLSSDTEEAKSSGPDFPERPDTITERLVGAFLRWGMGKVSPDLKV